MKYFCFISVFLFVNATAWPQRYWSSDLLWPDDWLVNKPVHKSEISYSKEKNEICLYNGLVKRKFRLLPNAACIDYKNMMNGQQLLRAISPKARLTINGEEYNVGGLHGQKEKAYLLPEWVNCFTNCENDF